MIKNIRKKLVTILSLGLLLAAPVIASGSAYALFDDAKGQAQCGANLSDAAGGCTDTSNSETKVSTTLQTVLNLLSIVIGVIAVIMLIVGGIKFTTSGGDSSKVSSARNTILYALIGLVVAALAQFIVKFIVGKVAN